MARDNFHEKKTKRIERYKDLINKNEKRSNEAFQHAQDLGSVIPFGQPILVGHHSEKKHRNHLKKIDNEMRKSVEASDKAKYYEDKLEGAENNRAIFSDDPEAIQKLKEKIKSLERNHELMKASNKVIRSKKFSEVEKHEKLLELGLTERIIQEVMHSHFPGFEGFTLSNSNAEIKRNKKRLERLIAQDQRGTQERTIGDIKLIENVEVNRIQFIFPDKPSDEIRAILKSHAFRWSPRFGAWQRHLNSNGRWAAKRVIEKLQELEKEA